MKIAYHKISGDDDNNSDKGKDDLVIGATGKLFK